MRHEGAGRLAMILLHLATSPFMEFGRLVFFMRELDGTWTAPMLPAGLEVGLASPSDLPLVVSAGRPDPRLPEQCRQRFQRGDRCVLIRATDGTVAHSRWVTTLATALPELGMAIVPRPGEVYFYDAYTRPDQRGQGIDGTARCFIFETSRAAGFKRAYTYVRGENPPGLRAAHRWMSCVGELWFLRIRGFRAWLIRRRDAGPTSGDAPPLSIEDRAGAWPDLS
jgi:hypothetical protein